MSDPQSILGQSDPVASPTTTDPTKPGQANPLDALEQILKEAKAKADQGKAAGAATTPATTEPVADEATRLAEIGKLASEQGEADQVAIGHQLQALEQVVNTPEYQARVTQDTQKKQTDEQKKQQADDYAIVQLGHTKV